MALSGFVLSTYAAIPITSYESTAVEIPEDYAVQGGYTGFSVGYNRLGDVNMKPAVVGGNSLPDLTTSSKAGYSLKLSSGYRLYRWRFEAELGYRSNEAEKVTDSSTNTEYLATDNTTAITIMGNIIYDRYYQSGWLWMLGGGIGAARIDYAATTDDKPNLSSAFNKASIVPAVQAILGIGYVWSDHIETAVSYHYFFPISSSYTSNNNIEFNNEFVEFKPDYKAHTINLEIRFT